MSKVQTLRVFVTQRLTAAAEEIFELFERTIAEYEEEVCRQRKLLDAVFRPEVQLHRADVEQLLVIKEEQQDRSSSLDQEDPPELPHIKEEQEELWSSQEGEEPQSSQLHQSQTEENRDDGEDCGGPEPARNLNPDRQLQPDSHEPETDDSWDWEDTQELCLGSECDASIGETRSHHPSLSRLHSQKKTLTCSICGKRFSHFGALRRHLTVHKRARARKPRQEKPLSSSESAPSLGRNGIRAGGKPFSCSVCGKRYPLSKSLKDHMRLHSEGKRFSCSVCKKTFPWRSGLVRHVRTHMEEKPFGCNFCDQSFAQNSSLISHLRVHTGEKPFKCSICKTRFRISCQLSRHMRLHSGEKPFSCTECGKNFAESGTLRRHMTVHSGEKPYSCSVCSKTFARPENLRRHSAVHREEKR